MDLLEQLMFAADLPVAKPRYRLIDGEWQNTTPPAPIEEKWVCDTDDHDDDDGEFDYIVSNFSCPNCPTHIDTYLNVGEHNETTTD